MGPDEDNWELITQLLDQIMEKGRRSILLRSLRMDTKMHHGQVRELNTGLVLRRK